MIKDYKERIKENKFVFNNYKELCIALEEPVKSGCSKKSQLKEFSRFFSWRKENKKIYIEKIYDSVVPKTRKPKGITSQRVKTICNLLYDMFARTEKNELAFNKKELFKELILYTDIFNDVNYLTLDEIISYLKKKEETTTLELLEAFEIDEDAIDLFGIIVRDYVNAAYYNTMKSLCNKGYFVLSTQYRIVKKITDEFGRVRRESVVATDAEADLIRNIQEIVYDKLLRVNKLRDACTKTGKRRFSDKQIICYIGEYKKFQEAFTHRIQNVIPDAEYVYEETVIRLGTDTFENGVGEVNLPIAVRAIHRQIVGGLLDKIARMHEEGKVDDWTSIKLQVLVQELYRDKSFLPDDDYDLLGYSLFTP